MRLILVGLVVGALTPSVAAAAAPTFSKDVAPILYKSCIDCHRPGAIAPMSLISFEDVRPWARAVKQRVVDRVMPPWGADPHIGKFANDPSLSDAEIKTIAAWVGHKDGGLLVAKTYGHLRDTHSHEMAKRMTVSRSPTEPVHKAGGMILTGSGDENRVQTRRFGAGERELELNIGYWLSVIDHWSFGVGESGRTC